LEVIMNHKPAPDTRTLSELYAVWLESAHAGKPGLTNAERSVPDQLNHRRALECFAAGVSDGAEGPDAVRAQELDVRHLLLGRRVERGARLLAERRDRAAPREKTLKNLISCCRALQALALDGKEPGQAGMSASELRRSRPKRKALPAFPQSEWGKDLVEQWEGFGLWKTKPILTPAEGKRYRKKACRPVTVEAHRERINPYVGWLVREKGRTELALRDLPAPQLFSEYLNWVLAQPHESGYTNARMTGIALATLSRYLVAKGELPELTPDGERIWDALYDLSREPMQVGAKRGHLRKPEGIGAWTPRALLQLGMEGWRTEPVRRQRGNEGRWANQGMVRKRSALFFILAHETPLRARNFREMRWHHQLAKQPDGRWRVTFAGEELKVAERGFRTNTYEHAYSPAVSRVLDEWYGLLEQHLGPNFEHTTPFVFPGFMHQHGENSGPLQHAAFSRSISDLCQELHGESFNLHKARHIVGTYVANELGPAGLGLAAEILGDTPATVLRAYYRPDTRGAYQEYLLRVQAGLLH